MQNKIDKQLNLLGLLTDSGGLIKVHSDILPNDNLYLQIIREDAAKYEADYVYVRHFLNQPPQPQVYIYDNTSSHWSEQEIAIKHKQIWNRGNVPLLYVFTRETLCIFSCLNKGDFLDDDGTPIYKPYESFELASATQDSLDLFSGKSLDTSALTLWEYKNDNKSSLFNARQAAHEVLVEAVKEFDQKLNEKYAKRQKTGRRLLILCFLIKYLEEREVFPSEFLEQFLPEGHRSSSVDKLFYILANKESLMALFDNLHKHFNGDVFKLDEDEKNDLDDHFLSGFAEIMEGKTLHRQQHFWRLYSFRDIPIEVISYVYQCFVNSKQAVYTPGFLVEMLIDEAMGEKSSNYDIKLLDPACGSGIFLVGAFKYLINKWRQQHDWKHPDIDVLKTILTNSIHGVDIDPAAVELTSFSLYLAVCDALEPKVIWDKLHFPKLRDNNIRQQDFFDCAKDDFDLIIGNPPFGKLQTKPAFAVNDKYARERGKLPDKNLAYLFLEHGITLCKANGIACLILPAGFLYNGNVHEYRKKLFEKYRVSEVLDFVSIPKLFETASVKVCTVIVHNQMPDENAETTHAVIRESKPSLEKMFFELDHYDVHRFPQKLAAQERLIWRSNLLGGYRVFEIARKKSNLPTLLDFIEKKQWSFGEGFIVGRKKAKKKAAHITGKPFIPTGAFTKDSFAEEKIRILDNIVLFDTPYTAERFTPPMLLIKAHESLPIKLWNEYLTFKDKILSVNNGSYDELSEVYNKLKRHHELYRFYLAILGSQALVGRDAAVLKADIEKLPYPDRESDLELSSVENIFREDIMSFTLGFIKQGHGFKEATQKPGRKELKDFGKVFCDALRAFCPDLSPAEPKSFNNLLCYPFYFNEKPRIDWGNKTDLETKLENLMQIQHGTSLYVRRLVTLFEGDVVYFVKPNYRRYWLKSIALRDSDTVFKALLEQAKTHEH